MIQIENLIALAPMSLLIWPIWICIPEFMEGMEGAVVRNRQFFGAWPSYGQGAGAQGSHKQDWQGHQHSDGYGSSASGWNGDDTGGGYAFGRIRLQQRRWYLSKVIDTTKLEEEFAIILQNVDADPVKAHGKLRYPPKATPPRQIRPY